MDEAIRLRLAAQYGDIYSLTIGNKEVTFRALTLRELNAISAAFTDANGEVNVVELEDAFVANAVVYPPDFDPSKTKAGYITSLAVEIGRVSGYSDMTFLKEKLVEAREHVNNQIQYMMKSLVILAMPSYTEEDLDELTFAQLLHKVALAEQILYAKQNVEGLTELVPPVSLWLTDGSEEEETEEEAPTRAPRKAKRDLQHIERGKTNLPSKEQLLNKIVSAERETVGLDKTSMDNIEALDSFEPEQLVNMLGTPKENDPIIERLHRAMGG